MRHGKELTWSQVVMAANTPMLLKAGLVEGNTEAGVLASGQVAGILDDLPSCAELIESIVGDAVKHLQAAVVVRRVAPASVNLTTQHAVERRVGSRSAVEGRTRASHERGADPGNEGALPVPQQVAAAP